MSTNDEMREYLHHLLDHQGNCTIEACAKCHIALDVYEFIRSRIFLIREYSAPVNHGNSQVAGAGEPNDTPRTIAAKRA
jgi:heterodisulfide reductase subunit B